MRGGIVGELRQRLGGEGPDTYLAVGAEHQSRAIGGQSNLPVTTDRRPQGPLDPASIDTDKLSDRGEANGVGIHEQTVVGDRELPRRRGAAVRKPSEQRHRLARRLKALWVKSNGEQCAVVKEDEVTGGKEVRLQTPAHENLAIAAADRLHHNRSLAVRELAACHVGCGNAEKDVPAVGEELRLHRPLRLGVDGYQRARRTARVGNRAYRKNTVYVLAEHNLMVPPARAVRLTAQRTYCKLIWQQLDGDVAIEPGVTRAIDLAHAARAGDAHDSYGPKRLPGLTATASLR
jgi:hypothetical protein